MCAASPAMKIRPFWKVSAASATARHLSTSSTSTSQVGVADRVAHQLHRQLVGDGVGHESGAGLVDVADREDHQEPAETGLLQPEEATHLRVVDVDHAEVAAAQRRRAVGPEVDRHAARQQTVADHLDAEALADRAAVAVAGHHVLGPDQCLGPVVDVANRRRDAIVVLLVADEFGRILEARAELAGPLQQDRLEHLLRHEQPSRRADVLDAAVDVRDVVGDLPTGQRLDGVETTVGVVELQRRGADPVLDAGDAHQLDRAQLEVAGPRMDRGAVVLLDREHLDAVLGQEHRRRQPDQAAADHEDRHVDRRSVDLCVDRGGDAESDIATTPELNVRYVLVIVTNDRGRVFQETDVD